MNVYCTRRYSFSLLALLCALFSSGGLNAESPQASKKKPVNSSAEPAPLTRLGAKQSPYQSLVVNNKLTLREFVAAIASQSHAERHYAEMYLVGVLDTTEGIDWCGYDILLPDSVASVMYTDAEKLVPTRGGERASTVIREILKDMASCRRQK